MSRTKGWDWEGFWCMAAGAFVGTLIGRGLLALVAGG